MDSKSLLQRIPVELWTKILNEDQGFTVGDFKTLCFVAPFFRTICQPLSHRRLRVREVNASYGYSWSTMGGKIRDLDRWKREMMEIVRAERRLRFIGGDASLSTYPQTMCIGTTGRTAPANIDVVPHARPPTGRMGLSRAVYEAYLRFKRTLVRTLPLLSQLRRLELASLTIDDKLLKAIASHTALSELKFIGCSFPSPAFSIPSIRSLEYNRISKREIPAALCLISPPHLEVLHLDNMDTSTVLNSFSEKSTCTKLHRLTIKLGSYNEFDLLSMETLLCKVPALHELEINGEPALVQNRNAEDSSGAPRTFKPSTIPYLRRFSGPLYFARHIVPGRPTSEIKIKHGDLCGRGISHPVSTWPELQSLFHPLCHSSATAEGITTFHLPNYNVAPIGLLSQFVTETFSRLIDVQLPVVIMEDQDKRDRLQATFRRRGPCCIPPAPRVWLPGTEGPFEDGELDEWVKEIRDSVDYQLLGRFEEPYHLSMQRASQIGRVGRDWSDSAIATAAMTMPKPDVARILIDLGGNIKLDSTGSPVTHPRDFQEALLYFAQGWHPLPSTIETLSLKPMFVSSTSYYSYVSHSRTDLETLEQQTCMALVTALGERYPSLASVMLIGPTGYRCQRIGGMARGETTWILIENDLWE